ncbi:tetratricopeptide repeat protein [Motilimonas pumila]|uniref:Uncharacterized protein n=1 Tax=Motilimonas pumila TaxID=2303987 RepID=A0A418YI18_9GAMM|nr:tetratricopeptide repeat protein [Motilimonas pumila]RJG49974.1 hypothetical protein D1Z90_04840 [Motilimonas pumila]
MSVINQMNKDLAQRQQSQVSPVVGSVPRQWRQQWPLIAGIGLFILLTGCIGYFVIWPWWQPSSHEARHTAQNVVNETAALHSLSSVTPEPKLVPTPQVTKAEEVGEQDIQLAIDKDLYVALNDGSGAKIHIKNQSVSIINADGTKTLLTLQPEATPVPATPEPKPTPLAIITAKPKALPKPVAPEVVIKASTQAPLPQPQLAADKYQDKAKDTGQPGKLKIKSVQLSSDELYALHLKQARAAKNKGDLSVAEGKFEKALRIKPRDEVVRKELAALKYGRGSEAQAMLLLQKGIELVPDSADFRLMLARIYMKSGDREGAVSLLDSYSPEVVANLDYYATLAALSQQLKMDDKAIKAYLELARRQPYQAKWWLGLAISQDRTGMREEALTSYQQADVIGGLSPSSSQYIKQRIAKLEP